MTIAAVVETFLRMTCRMSMMSLVGLTFRIWAIALVGVPVLAETSAARDLAVEREEILTDDLYGAYEIQPAAITRTDDGGFVVAGRIEAHQSAWATKIDAAGKAVWRYDSQIREKLPLGQGAAFTGAVTTANGVTVLCGNMPSSRGSRGLIVRLGEDGRAVSESVLVPTHGDGAVSAVGWFRRCLRWGGGVAVIGSAHLAFPPVPPSPLRSVKDYYWVLLIDSSGAVAWERLILPAVDDTIESVESALVADGGDLVFTAHRSPRTEVVQIDPSGGVRARLQLPQRYLLLQPTVSDGLLQLYGSGPVDFHELIELGDSLTVRVRVSGKQSPLFVTRDAFRLSDRALVLFGGAVLDGGVRRVSRAMVLAPSLDTENFVDLLRQPYVDNGRIPAATAGFRAGEFAAVRPLQKSAPGADARMGAVITFLTLR